MGKDKEIIMGPRVAVVVCRSGRLDLVRSSTLLIVGGENRSVIPLNESAYKKLDCPKEMVVVPGATHLFEEPGALEQVAELAGESSTSFRQHQKSHMTEKKPADQ